MTIRPPDSTPLRFADFDLDLSAAELRRAGTLIKLAPQQYELLALLVSRPGQLVTRDQLRRHLWGDDRFVDFDAGLNYCVAQLRLALGDSALRPRFIQTAPRRGYRFGAPVTRHQPEPLAAGQEAATPRPMRQWWLAAMFAAGAAVGGFVVMVGHQRVMVPPSPSALSAFERARGGLEAAGPYELRERVLLFQRAVAENPSFAEALGGLAIAHSIAGFIRFAPPADAYARARAAARTALTVDRHNADAHAALGFEALHDRWDWAESERHLAAALARDPRHTFALSALSRMRSASGRHEEAAALARRAVEAAPSSTPARLTLAWSYMYAGDFARAAGLCASILDAASRSVLQAAECRLNAHTGLQRASDARDDVIRIAQVSGRPQSEVNAIESRFAADAIRGLWQWRLEDVAAQLKPGRRPTAESLAVLNARLRHDDEALRWLAAAVDERANIAIVLNVHPAFAELRRDPRFEALVRRIGGQ